MIETERLVLRPPEDRDREALAVMNADPEVAAWLSGPLTREESDALVDRIRVEIGLNGWGFWAVERKADVQFDLVAPIPISAPLAEQDEATREGATDAATVAGVLEADGISSSALHLGARGDAGNPPRQIEVYVR